MEQSPPSLSCDVAVIGAGPSGLMAAWTAAQHRAHVWVFEKLDEPGVRLLATGGGRCNLSNTLDPPAFMARFGPRGRFLQPALAAFGAPALRGFLSRRGVPTFAPDGIHIYPRSESATDVRDALTQAGAQAGVGLSTRCPVNRLLVEGGRIIGVESRLGLVTCPRVILATGGRSYRRLGGGDAGYELARQAGHTIADPLPALVPLRVREPWPRSCAGSSLRDVELRLEVRDHRPVFARGDVQFTHHGLSGPAALDISGEVSARLCKESPVILRMNVEYGVSSAHWRQRLQSWRNEAGRRTVLNWLDRALPRNVAEVLLKWAGLQRDTTASRLPRSQMEKLAGFSAAQAR